MPPLYVGKSTNLRQRYGQHVSVDETQLSGFGKRFNLYADELGLPLQVADLVFACVRSPVQLSDFGRDEDHERLLEHVLIRIARPPFGLR